MILRSAFNALWNPTEELLSSIDTASDACEKSDMFLKHLKIRLHRRLGSPYPGEYRGVFKGHGMDLKSLREYQPGDEIRKIDWNVFARTGIPHVKEHYEEKQIPVWFFVDATPSMHFGQTRSKLSYAKVLVGLLGLMALEIGHRVGLILWKGEGALHFVKPKPLYSQLEWMIDEIDTVLSQESKTMSKTQMDFPNLPAILQNHCLVFMLSDFEFLETASLKVLARLSPKHQVESMLLVDPVEAELVSGHGWLPVAGGEGCSLIWLNTSDKALLESYQGIFQERLNQKMALLSAWSKPYTISTRDEPMDVVFRLVKGP